MTVSVGADADGLLPGRHGGPSLIEEKDAYGPRNRHSDKEKFRNDLNGPKSCEMSERLLKHCENPETSKLNTRVRFPSPAPFSISF